MSNYQFRLAAEIMQQGGVIAYPSESVYGLGCSPDNPFAIQQLLELKQRPVDKGLILVASNYSQLIPYLDHIPDDILTKINAYWPGPTTWLLPKKSHAPYWLSGKHALQAVRVSNHPSVQKLCESFNGAVISTSANLSGRPAAKTSIQVKIQFGNSLDFILGGSVGGLKKPCEIRHALSNAIIRTAD